MKIMEHLNRFLSWLHNMFDKTLKENHLDLVHFYAPSQILHHESHFLWTGLLGNHFSACVTPVWPKKYHPLDLVYSWKNAASAFLFCPLTCAGAAIHPCASCLLPSGSRLIWWWCFFNLSLRKLNRCQLISMIVCTVLLLTFFLRPAYSLHLIGLIAAKLDEFIYIL